MNYGGEWLKYNSNFDDLSDSLLILFTISQTYSWTTPLNIAINSVGLDKIPIQGYSRYNSIFFIFLVVVMNFLITNIFVGLVVASYNRERDKMGSDFMMTAEQRKWAKTKLIVISCKPKLYLKLPN